MVSKFIPLTDEVVYFRKDGTMRSINMDNKFTIEICSDLDYEEMVADISYENDVVAIITQEDGIENMKIQILSPASNESWNFILDDFIEAIGFAKKTLNYNAKASSRIIYQILKL